MCFWNLKQLLGLAAFVMAVGLAEGADRPGTVITNDQFASAYSLARQFAYEQGRRWSLDRSSPDVVQVTEQQALGMADGKKVAGIYSPWLICLTPWSRPSTWLYELAQHLGEEDEATCERFAEWALTRVSSR
jgi:hypothetical protein